jgi:hypothetical protein
MKDSYCLSEGIISCIAFAEPTAQCLKTLIGKLFKVVGPAKEPVLMI